MVLMKVLFPTSGHMSHSVFSGFVWYLTVALIAHTVAALEGHMAAMFSYPGLSLLLSVVWLSASFLHGYTVNV